MVSHTLGLKPSSSTPIAGRLNYARWAYVAAFAVVVAIGYALDGASQRFVAIVSGALGVAGVLYGTFVLRPLRSTAWVTLAVGVGLVAAGEVCLGMAAPIGASYPSVADILFTVAYLPVAVALLWIGHPPSALFHWPAALDAAVLSLAGSMVAWFALFRPALINLNLGGAARTMAILDWVGDITIMAVGILMILTWRANRSVHLLGVAVAALLAADVVNGIMLARGAVARGVNVDIAFVLFCLFCGLAAMHPAMTGVTSHAAREDRLSAGRLFLLALALLVPPSILLAEATRGPVDVLDAVAIISGLVALLLLARIANAIRTLRDRATRERALRTTMSALSVAGTADEVQHDLREAVEMMIGHGAPAATLHPPDVSLVIPTFGLLGNGRRARVRFPVSPTTLDESTAVGEIRIEGPRRRLHELVAQLSALADQAGAALARICLGEAVREHERESYFRTLVRNSNDVILICRDGVVEYATPSAEDLFGDRPVIGEKVTDLMTVGGPAPGADARSGPGTDARSGADAREGVVKRGDGIRNVKVRRRDLTDDPTVRGVVLTVQDVTAQRQLQDELTHRATHDALTGLANGSLLRERLREAEHAASPDLICAVLFIDLDNFKEVNDSLGHAAGDELLKRTADRLHACLRRDQDMAARLGGDEFAIVLRNLHTIAAARDVAARVVTAFRRPIHVHDVAVNCTVSVGLAAAGEPDEYDSLLRRADIAVYATKAAGRDGWSEYQATATPAVGASGRSHTQPPIGLHYQPIVDLASGKAIGFEALSRLGRQHQPMTTPAEYIADAENNGLIVAIGDWVIDEALRDAPHLNEIGSRYVSVNVSPVQLRQRDFAERVLDRLSDSGMGPADLMVELTERLQVDPQSSAWDELTKLHDAGVRVALDDYGTGYASLSYLRQKSIDVIKLDRLFTKEIRKPRARAVLEVAVAASRRLDIGLIIEGVETAATRDAVMSAGCEYGQGLYYAPALPVDVAARWSHGPAGTAR